MVASFEKHKDHETFLEAAVKLESIRKDLVFLAVGEGSTYLALKEKYKDFENILFTGRINYVEAMVQMFDIGVLMTYGEGISNSILEYMALSKSVIVSEGGATPELVENGISGFIIKRGSVDELIDNISFLMDNESVRIQMGAKGKESIKRKFSIEQMVENFKESYNEITA